MSYPHEWRDYPSVNPRESLGIILAYAVHIDLNMNDKRIGLIGTYKTNGTTVRLHTVGCSAAIAKRAQVLVGAVTADDLADWSEREYKVTVCPCAK